MRARLIDFGLCLNYKDENGKHFEEEKTSGFRGNLEYASTYILDGFLPSRRDDLISLVYILIHLLKNFSFN